MDQEKQNWNMYYIKGAWRKATKKEKKHKEVGKKIGRSAAAALSLTVCGCGANGKHLCHSG